MLLRRSSGGDTVKLVILTYNRTYRWMLMTFIILLVVAVGFRVIRSPVGQGPQQSQVLEMVEEPR